MAYKELFCELLFQNFHLTVNMSCVLFQNKYIQLLFYCDRSKEYFWDVLNRIIQKSKCRQCRCHLWNVQTRYSRLNLKRYQNQNQIQNSSNVWLGSLRRNGMSAEISIFMFETFCDISTLKVEEIHHQPIDLSLLPALEQL